MRPAKNQINVAVLNSLTGADQQSDDAGGKMMAKQVNHTKAFRMEMPQAGIGTAAKRLSACAIAMIKKYFDVSIWH